VGEKVTGGNIGSMFNASRSNVQWCVCSFVQMFNVQLASPFKGQLTSPFKCSLVQMFKCSMVQCSIGFAVQMFKGTATEFVEVQIIHVPGAANTFV
jgi:hypothetical protein